MTISNESCRTCLQTCKSFVNIFEHREQDKSVADLLKECTTVEIDTSDGLPSYICSHCVGKLISASTFKAMVIDSDLKLRGKKDEVSISVLSNSEMVTIKEEVTVKYEEVNLSIIDKGNTSDNKKVQDERKECVGYSTNVLEQDTNSSNEKEYDEWPSMEDNADDPNPNEESDNDTPIENHEDKPENDQREDLNNSPSKNESGKEDMEDELNDILQLTKDGRKLTRKEKEKTTVFCKQCNRSFGWKYYTSVHIKHHVGDKPYKCDICGKAFVLPFQLKNHKRLHADETPFSCNICRKPFKQLSAVYSHKLVHTQERPHKCNICGKGFKQSYSLNVHIRTHTKDTMFVCEVCGKSFTDHSTFSVHKTIHLTEKIFPCPVCNRSYASNVRMREHHKKSHSDRKPHVCSHCGKQFKETSTLKAHILTHTGEKPYSCNICGKSFRQLACIPRHMRIHTGETPYPCKSCPATFKYSHHLKNHMKVHS